MIFDDILTLIENQDSTDSLNMIPVKISPSTFTISTLRNSLKNLILLKIPVNDFWLFCRCILSNAIEGRR